MSSVSRWTQLPTTMPEGGRWLHIRQIKYTVPTQPDDIYATTKQCNSSADQSKGNDDQRKESEERVQTQEATWEVVCRSTTTKAAGGVDAGEIVVIIKESHEQQQQQQQQQEEPTNSCTTSPSTMTPTPTTRKNFLALVAQYRAPLDSNCLEFPAGLIDEGESPIESALRELSEETGIADGRLGASVSVKKVSPAIAYEPGMTSSTCVMIHVEVDLPTGMTAAQYSADIVKHRHLEETEMSMQLVLVPFDERTDVAGELQKMLKMDRIKIDAKVWSFCLARSI